MIGTCKCCFRSDITISDNVCDRCWSNGNDIKSSPGTLRHMSEHVERTIREKKVAAVPTEFAKFALAVHWIRERQPIYFIPRVRYYAKLARAIYRGEWEIER